MIICVNNEKMFFYFRYRVIAIDHGVLSFTDVEHNDWPVILVTNPKHALFVNPLRENLESIRNSRFIR